MFEPPPPNQEPRPTRQQRLPAWGLPSVLLAMTVALAAYYGSLARQDAVAAPREQIAVGKMIKLTHGKHTTALYSFTWAGKQYHGKDNVSSSHCFCDVTVYFDPVQPSTNSLVEYKRKAWADHLTMIFCLWMSAGLTVILALALVFAKRRTKEADYSRAS